MSLTHTTQPSSHLSPRTVGMDGSKVKDRKKGQILLYCSLKLQGSELIGYESKEMTIPGLSIFQHLSTGLLAEKGVTRQGGCLVVVNCGKI